MAKAIGTNTQKQNHRHRDTSLTLLIFSHVILLLLFVFFRLIDGDEGIFLRAAQLIQAGQVPYFDFFYMQMPYLPYLLAPISLMGFSSLILSRLLAAGLSLVSALIIYKSAERGGASKHSLRLLYLLLLSNGLFLAWQTTVKTQVFSDYFGIASFCYFLTLISESHRRVSIKWPLLLVGILVGLAINIRSIHVLLLLSELVLLWLFLPKGSRKTQGTIMVLSGVFIASLGSLVLFIQDPHLFWLHNVTLHQQWGSQIVRQSASVKLTTIAKFFCYPQTIILLVPLYVSLRNALKTPPGKWSILQRLSMSATLVAVTFSVFYGVILDPVQFQYFEQVVPFLVLAGIPGWEIIIHSVFWQRWKILTLSVYVAGLLPFMLIFLMNYRDIDTSNSLKTIRATLRTIDQNTVPGDTILSANTYLPQFANRPMVKGMEVDGRQLLKILEPVERGQIQLMDSLTFINLASARLYTTVLFDTTQFPDLGAQLQHQYKQLDTPSSVRIWQRILPEAD